MVSPQLNSNNNLVRLIEPNVARDAVLGVAWLNGQTGRDTMRSMGNSEATLDQILPTTLKLEADRIQSFIERIDQLNWMIEFDNKVAGSVWVDLKDSENVPTPSVHIMIGDPDMRGQSIGSLSIELVLGYLEKLGHTAIYSRHVSSNLGADKLLKNFGFADLGKPYMSDGLEFQNLKK